MPRSIPGSWVTGAASGRRAGRRRARRRRRGSSARGRRSTRRSRRRAPRGTPGPRISSGTRIDGSYGRTLPGRTRCSPSRKPLSDVKMSSVSSSSPAARSAPTIRATPSSTATSEASRWRCVWLQRPDLPWPQPRLVADPGRLVGHVGLVERRRAEERGAEERLAVAGGRDRRVEAERIVEVVRAADVGSDVGRPHEERPRLGVDEAQRAARDQVGLVLAPPVAVVLDVAVHVHPVVIEAVREPAQQALEVGPAGRDAGAARTR